MDGAGPEGTRERAVLDVAGLPTAVFGHRSTLWWGTLGFVASELTTLAMAGWAFFYVRGNFPRWPPAARPDPDMVAATIGMLVLLLMIPVALRADRAAKRFDARRAARWLWAEAGLGVVVAACRFLEYDEVNVRWDDDAYGSVLWTLLGLHLLLVLTDILETATMAAILGSDRWEAKHLSDVDDALLYQWFLTLVWVPIYVMIYWLPRL